MDQGDLFKKHIEEPVKRKYQKKNSYSRLSNVNKIWASQIHSEDVELLFKPDFSNCPGEADGVGRKIDGNMVDEVLSQIIEQFELSVHNIKEFNKVYEDQVPEYNKNRLQHFIKLLNVAFNDNIEIDGKETGEQIAAYKQAISNVMKYKVEIQKASKYPCKETSEYPVFMMDLERLLRELSGSPDYTTPNASSLQKAMTKYWIELLNYITFHGTYCDGSAETGSTDIFKQVLYRENGGCLFEFEMKVSNVYILKNMKELNDEQKRLLDVKCMINEDDDDTTGSQKVIIAQPDLSAILTLSELEADEDGSSMPALGKLFFVAQMTGPQQMAKCESDSMSTGSSTAELSEAGTDSQVNTNSTDNEASSSSMNNIPVTSKRKSQRHTDRHKKRRKCSDTCETKDEQHVTAGLSSQHFIDLLCALKYGHSENNLSEISTCFGMYCVNHRFYITCLAAVSKSVQSCKMMLSMRKRKFFSTSKTPADFKDHEQIKLKMFCSDYLDMFNPVHMEAMLKFLAFLISYEV